MKLAPQLKRQLGLGGTDLHKADDGDPKPKKWEDLDGAVRDCLVDFNQFSEAFLCRRPVPWRLDAANRLAEHLLDKTSRTYVDINTPPGAGKTTTFTHDFVVWLICGGGSLDPAVGRALRVMLGARTKNVARHYCSRVRRTFERQGKFYDKTAKREADLGIIAEFGYFKPKPHEGDPDSVWRAEEFIVAQLSGIDLYEMEPTVQSASQQSGFLGERVDYYSWDDLATKENSNNADVAASTAEWFEDEAETRLEPGGVGALVGQRLGNLDLHKNRLDAVWIDEGGETRRKYEHIVYPAHFDDLCDGDHRQWDGTREHGHGCLLDEVRLPWRELVQRQSQSNYQTVYQQKDADPESVLVQREWIEGGDDYTGYPAPGCKDRNRGFKEWPDLTGLVDYVVVDPSVSGWWAFEWWAYDPEGEFNYLIYGTRRKMQASDFLDYSAEKQAHVGLMEQLQEESGELGHPITTWVVEQNAAHRYLFQTEAYRTWRRKWPKVHVIAHSTQRNKLDDEFGVRALLPGLYREGRKRLPFKHGDLDAVAYVGVKIKELTNYPHTDTDDTVMADWFGETNIKHIGRQGGAALSPTPKPPSNLPPYLQRQIREVAIVG